MKQKTVYKCTNCNYQPPKWVGCCPECNEWESVVGTEVSSTIKGSTRLQPSIVNMVHLSEVSPTHMERMDSGIHEWDRVVGGGIMPGSFLILTGDPGIGKSTLLLQIAHHIAKKHRVFYFSSEESLEQVKLRAERLGCDAPSLLFSDQAKLELIIGTSQAEKPDLVVVDSIQNCYASEIQTLPGSIGQLRESAFQFMRLAKENNIALIVSGHITKEGDIAGPKMLEHMVDGVFYLQGEDRWQTRVLRSVKNRFGNINELGFFEMDEAGMQEVPNINQELLNATSFAPGSALISYREGSRPLLLELQALTIASKFGIPQRVVTGIDQKRVMLIAAILEKYLQVKFSTQDIFFKVSGGFKVKDSSSDLGIALALLSSYFQQSIPEKSIALGEVSLTGQIKPINHISMHISEAHNFGIQNLLVARNQKIEKSSAKITRFHNVYELLALFEE
jgi:DNA repair protein RadA/Sms